MAEEVVQPLQILLINQNWLQSELEALGHQVVCAACYGLGEVSLPEEGATVEELWNLLPDGFVPDRLIYFDNSGVPWLFGLERLPVPSLFYSVDAHHHGAWHPLFGALFDRVAVAQQSYVALFRDAGIETSWIPLWATRCAPPQAAKTIDVCFRGTLDAHLHPKRTEFFEALRQFVPIDAAPGDYARDYPLAKIVVNEAVKDDINFRVFEAMACGALLITPDCGNGLFELFEEGVDLVTYRPDDVADAAAKVSYYLEHDAERIKIAEHGWRKVSERHSNRIRAQEFLELLADLSPISKPQRNLRSAQSCLAGAAGMRKVHSPSLQKYLREAKRLLLASAERGEPAGDEFAAAALLIQYYEQECGVFSVQDRFMESLLVHRPDDALLALGAMEALLSRGDNSQAQVLAARYSPYADELLASVPRLLSDAREHIRRNNNSVEEPVPVSGKSKHEEP